MEPGPDSQRPDEPLSTSEAMTDSDTERGAPQGKDDQVAVAHDSLVTVRLSESTNNSRLSLPPTLSINTDLPPNVLPSRRSILGPQYTPSAMSDAASTKGEEHTVRDTIDEKEVPGAQAPTILLEELEQAGESNMDAHEPSAEMDDDQAMDESDTEEVNWDELQKTEDQQVKDQDDNDSTAMLLARLEQENNKLATNPKSVKVKSVEQLSMRRPRPPSMAQLREMVQGPPPAALRYSMLPPPPMTDLEFYSALVKDYQQTAARLPTLLSNKIRKGVPPPLRGVVWQSMAGARDSLLLEQFDRLSGESSPYDGIIGKDLGRSFPGVDMFRDPDGDGQRMLGRVLKCFSLYDQKIGYCQGLAFLVGPLLMHMPDNQAFCVLVRLMETYDLRSCFLPDLSGLHVRIYQFKELLRQNLPALSNHLDDHQVNPAYVSQWFLSFFAVTCPLPMLFRIYDVVFAEGASETVMRVALSLMRKNESRILACTEFEDVMQLLLSRGLWDCYQYNADAFVDDFVSLSNVVSREKLAQLEQSYRESQVAVTNAPRISDITTSATRFLGRLWNISPAPRSATLSPGLTAPPRPLSMLRRSTSKQSLASTLNSMDAVSSSVASSVSTDATTTSRDSSGSDGSLHEATPVAAKQNQANAGDRHLHNQIEDLLTALSELQRDHALLATELQREREEREDDKKAVKSLLTGLKKGTFVRETSSPDNDATPTLEQEEKDSEASETQTPVEPPSPSRLSLLLEGVQERFGITSNRNSHRTSTLQTKSQLRDELAKIKEHLMNEVSKTQELNRHIEELGKEAASTREQLRESHAHVRNLVQDKQRLEKQVHTMRARASTDVPSAPAEANGWFSNSASNNSGGAGLRELKLGRSKSTPNTQAHFEKRSSSMPRTQTEPAAASVVNQEQEALVLELVQAKTAEAVARQEADEYKQKLESLRKACGLAPGDTPPAGATTASTAMGMIGRLTNTISASEASGSTSKTPAANAAKTSGTATPPAAPTASGGFWGWRR